MRDSPRPWLKPRRTTHDVARSGNRGNGRAARRAGRGRAGAHARARAVRKCASLIRLKNHRLYVDCGAAFLTGPLGLHVRPQNGLWPAESTAEGGGGGRARISLHEDHKRTRANGAERPSKTVQVTFVHLNVVSDPKSTLLKIKKVVVLFRSSSRKPGFLKTDPLAAFWPAGRRWRSRRTRNHARRLTSL